MQGQNERVRNKSYESVCPVPDKGNEVRQTIQTHTQTPASEQKTQRHLVLLSPVSIDPKRESPILQDMSCAPEDESGVEEGV